MRPQLMELTPESRVVSRNRWLLNIALTMFWQSSNVPRTVRTLSEHVDVDVTGLLQREITLDQAGDKLLDNMLRTANGRLTAAEALGHREFVLTRLYESA